MFIVTYMSYPEVYKMTFTKFETKGTIWLSNLDVHSYRDELHIWLLSCVNIIYVTLDNKTSHKGQLYK